MKPTLLILAAGMGSRYGGLKQLDGLGPHGETIMDYSISDAVTAGFDKVVFVIRRNMEDDFKQYILSKYTDKIVVDYIFQELDTLPAGFTVPSDRKKPYGTAHAILAAKNAINAPFAVINADDFYGRDSYVTLADFLVRDMGEENPCFAMVGYCLSKTLSENGTVSRGVCETDLNGNLTGIREYTSIQKEEDGIRNIAPDGEVTYFEGDTTVSMNFWGFTPVIFTYLEDLFVEFLKDYNHDPAAEFPIPSVINHLLVTKTARIKVLKSEAEWFGVTYREDRDKVVEKLKAIAV